MPTGPIKKVPFQCSQYIVYTNIKGKQTSLYTDDVKHVKFFQSGRKKNFTSTFKTIHLRKTQKREILTSGAARKS